MSNGTHKGMLGSIPQHKVVDVVNGTRMNMTRNPYFVKLGSEFDIQSAIYDVETTYGNTSISKVNQSPYILMMPDGYVSFYEVDTSKAQLNYSMSVNDLPYRNYHRLNNFTKIAFVGQRGFSLKDPLVRPDLGQYQLIQMVSRAFTKWVLWDTFGVNITDTAPNLPPEWRNFLDLTWIWPMPYYGSQDIWALLEAFGVILYPVALTLQLPIYICTNRSHTMPGAINPHLFSSLRYSCTGKVRKATRNDVVPRHAALALQSDELHLLRHALHVYRGLLLGIWYWILVEIFLGHSLVNTTGLVCWLGFGSHLAGILLVLIDQFSSCLHNCRLCHCFVGLNDRYYRRGRHLWPHPVCRSSPSPYLDSDVASICVCSRLILDE
jgi:hypothetical protein